MRDADPLRIERIEFIERSSIEVGWFPHVEIALSYWHGGQRLKDGTTWAWRNDSSILDTASFAAKQECERYGITPHSTLELVQIRRDKEELKVVRDGRWTDISQSRSLGIPTERVLKSYLIWSSKGGAAPPLEVWKKHRIGFAKYVPIAGSGASEADLTRFLSPRVSLNSDDFLYSGVALSDATIQNLQITAVSQNPDDCRRKLVKITGEFEIATKPGNTLDPEALLGHVAEDVSLEAWPNGKDLRWDDRATKEPDTEWSILPK